MARFSLLFSKRKAVGMGGFHADYIDQKINQQRKRKSMGPARTVFTAISLIMGGAMFYVSLHYLPALVQPQKILGLSGITLDESAVRLHNRNALQRLFAPYLDAFDMQRTYLRSGQTIQAQYVLPEGSQLDLHIQQCRRFWLVEIFHCQTISQDYTQVTDRIGTQAFTFQDSGFYHFQDKVTLPEGETHYRVIWSRK